MDGLRQDGLIRGAISETRTAFITALTSGDAKAASAVYAENAILLPPSAELLRGRAAIEAFWRAGLDAGISEVDLETLDLTPRDGLAYEIGRYALQLTPPDGNPVIDRGKYLLVHERQADGAWQWAVEMFNPDDLSVRQSRIKTPRRNSMSRFSDRLIDSTKMSLPRRILALGLAFTFTVATTAVVAAVVTSNPGPFTGCLADKTTAKGALYNVAIGSAPTAACTKGDSQITFSNAQGPIGPQGPQGATGTNGTNGTDGTDGTNGTDGAPGAAGPTGPAGGLSGYQIVSGDVSVAGTVYCPAGKSVLGGGAEIIDNTNNHYALEASNPSGQIGWTAIGTLVEDHNAAPSDFTVVSPPLVLRIWAICAATS